MLFIADQMSLKADQQVMRLMEIKDRYSF